MISITLEMNGKRRTYQASAFVLALVTPEGQPRSAGYHSFLEAGFLKDELEERILPGLCREAREPRVTPPVPSNKREVN